FRTAVVSAAFAVVLPALSGCGDDSKSEQASRATSAGTPASSKAEEAPSDPKTPATSAVAARTRPDLPDLPSGAGAVDADAPEEFTETDSGLRYRVLRKSEGQKPQVNDRVVADYQGWLDGGKVFDSSYRSGRPLPFTLKTGPGGVIPGWVEGLQFVGTGG